MISGKGTSIGFRGRGVVFALLAMIAGLWPLLAFGEPSYIADSSSYYRGGQAAWEHFSGLLHQGPAEVAAAPSSAAPAGNPRKEAVGVRSLVYSVTTFVLSWPGTSLLLLIVSQTAVAALLLWLFLRATASTSWVHVVGVPATIGLATSFPVFATLATPDLWAGLMLLCTVLLALFWSKLGGLERLFVMLSLAFAVASHASHIVLAACILGLISVVAVAQLVPRFNHLALGTLVPPAAGLAAGLAISFLSGLIAFGDASVVPKRYPYALARAIEDGPARWYLQDQCPRAHYAVCELFPEGLPRGGVGDFLWGERGLARRATPEQMERIRAEEPEILTQALAAYPWYQVQASTRNVLRQFALISISPTVYQGRTLDAQGYLQSGFEVEPRLRWHAVLQSVGVLFSLLVLLLGLRRTPRPVRQAFFITVGLIVLNDLICAILSAPDLRYQSRTLWLLPVLAVVTLVGARSSSATVRQPVAAAGESACTSRK